MKKIAMFLFAAAIAFSLIHVTAGAVYYGEGGLNGIELALENDENVIEENLKSDRKPDEDEEPRERVVTTDKKWYFSSFTLPFVLCAALTGGLSVTFAAIDSHRNSSEEAREE